MSSKMHSMTIEELSFNLFSDHVRNIHRFLSKKLSPSDLDDRAKACEPLQLQGQRRDFIAQ